MPVRIRLARKGRRKKPFYHIVVADSRSPRDGKFIELIGSYNPMTKPATIDLDRDKAYEWLLKGAQPSDTARAILRFKGVLYKKHLQRGVAKGAMDQDAADKLLAEWIADKDVKIAARVAETAKEKADFLKLVSGVAKPKKVVAAPVEDAAAFREDAPVADAEAPAEVKAEAPAEVKAEAPAEVKEEVKEEVAEVKSEAPAPAEVKEEAPAEKKEEAAPTASAEEE